MFNKIVLSTFLILYLFIFSSSGQIKNANKTSYYKFPDNITEKDYIEKTIIFKIKEAHKESCYYDSIALKPVSKILKTLKIDRLEKKFPLYKNNYGNISRFAFNEKKHGLTQIYELHYNKDLKLDKVINRLYNTGFLEYAQPHYIQKAHFVPDDEAISNNNQYYLENIKAFEGWNLEKGDSNVVIGIVDSGIDMDHPDLKDKIYINTDDPVDGIDNDEDGYIDNYMGWDLVGDDYNNPSPDNDPDVFGKNNTHGVHVSGLAGAETNNSEGMASAGYNCSILPVKCAADNDYRNDSLSAIMRGYEGIKYAADAGADIINCSWGSVFAGEYEKNIIEYATDSKNSLLVVSAGNANTNDEYFPAFFDKVLTVAATDKEDVKTDFSNFGRHVDISAPGSKILSTVYDDEYKFFNGTSMSSPLVAGAAGLVKSKYPDYTPKQIGKLLKSTADNIYDIDKNNTDSLKDKLGSGRLNIKKALSYKGPGMEMVNYNFNEGKNPTAGDTMRIFATFTNHINSSSDSLKVSLKINNSHVYLIKDDYTIGTIGKGDTVTNHNNPFRIVLDSSISINEMLTIKFIFKDKTFNYSGFRYIKERVNYGYKNVEKNEVATTLTSIGRTGYFKDNATLGQGFIFNGYNLLYEMGLMVGTASNKLSNTVRPNIIDTSEPWDNDFHTLSPITLKSTNSFADFKYQSVYNDSIGGPDKVSVKVKQNTYIWKNVPDNKYIINEYIIENTSDSTIDSLYAGLFTDWDILSSMNNRVGWDSENEMGVAFNLNNKRHYAAVQILNAKQKQSFYAIDNNDEEPDIGVYDGFTDREKLYTLSSGLAKVSAGTNTYGNDISMVNGTGPYNLKDGEKVKIAIALIADTLMSGLDESAKAAKSKYQIITQSHNNTSSGRKMKKISLYPNPASNKMYYNIPSPNINDNIINVRFFNAAGIQKMQKKVEDKKGFVNIESLPEGFYIIKVNTGKRVYSNKLLIRR